MHARKRSRSKEGRTERDEKKRRKQKAESVSPESISDTDVNSVVCHFFSLIVWIRRGLAHRP